MSGTVVLTCRELADEYIAETGLEKAAAELVARIELGEAHILRQNLSDEERAGLDATVSRQHGRELLLQIHSRADPTPLQHEVEALLLFGMTEEDGVAAAAEVERLRQEENRWPRPGDLPGANEDHLIYKRLEHLQQATPEQREERRRRLLTKDFQADPPEVLTGPTNWLKRRVFPEVWDATGRVDDFLQALVRIGEEERERERLEYIETLLAEAEARAEEAEAQAAGIVRLGIPGANAMMRSPRMIYDLVERGSIEISAADWSRLNSGFANFSSLAPAGIEVALGLLRILTEAGMPDVGDKRPPASLEPILVSLPGGLSQLADACGYERTESGEYGPAHSRNIRRRMAAGLEALTRPVDLFHVWPTWTKKVGGGWGKGPKEYVHARAAIVQILNEGAVRRRAGDRSRLFLSPHAIHIGLHPWVLLGARTVYEDAPGDLPARYHDALHALSGRAREDHVLRAVLGDAELRAVTTDWCLILWCITHRNRGTVTITDEKLMDQIGLTRDLNTRQTGRAMKRLDRAVLVAQEMGVLSERRIEKPGMATYIFRRALPPGP